MTKYIKNYLTVSAATEATDILSPNVTYVRDKEKVLMANVGDNKELEIVLDASGNPQIQEKLTRDYLTFTCIQGGSISMENFSGNTPNIEYSKNGGEWTTWDYSNIDLSVDDVVKMKGINANGISTSTANYSKFTMTGKVAASGNIMSLIDGEKDGIKVIPGTGCCFYRLFYGCSSLTAAPELPATTLVNSCYFGIFSGCSSLTTAPELPATTLAGSCYYQMFQGCRSLTTAPELPATTLAVGCYQYMFISCKALTKAPTLTATSLAQFCYQGMFQNCTSLNYIKAMFITKPSPYYTKNWVYGVAATGAFVKNASATWDVTGDNGVPSGWTVQTA